MNNPINHLDLAATYRLYPKEYTFFSNPYEAFSLRDYILRHRIKFSIFKGINLIYLKGYKYKICSQPQLNEIGNQQQEENWVSNKYVEVKQCTPKQSMGRRRKQREITK